MSKTSYPKGSLAIATVKTDLSPKQVLERVITAVTRFIEHANANNT